MRRLLTFFAIGALIATVLNFVSKATPPAERTVFDGMLGHAHQIEALTIGSSVSAAVDFKTWGAPGWHMWTPGSDLLENEYLVRAAAPRLPTLRVVLIAVPPIAFQWLSTARGASEVRREQYLAAGPRISDGAIDGDWRDFAITWAFPLVRDDQWRDPIAAGLAAAGLRVSRPRDLMARHGRWLSLTRAAEPERLRGSASAEASPVFAGVLATVAADPDAPRRLAAVPPRIARFLAARGVQAVFYTPPVTPQYEAIFDTRRPPGVTDAREDMRRIASANHLIYLDLSRDPDLGRELDRRFYDNVHLTVDGASVFTTRLRRALEQRAFASDHAAPVPDGSR